MNLLLEGNVVDTRDEAITVLSQKLRKVSDELEVARREAREWQEKYEETYAQTSAIQRVLQPQFDALKKLFGMLPAGNDAPAGEIRAPQFDQRWDAWKQKLGPGTAPARVIDALLMHGPLNRSQLRQAGELGWSTLDAATSRLKNLSLIEKVGDRWNLKAS